MSVDPATAVSTPIGNGSGEVGVLGACAAQPAHNPVTGTSYYIQSRYDGGVWEDTHLAIIDVSTGISTTVGRFFLDPDKPIYPRVTALAIDLDGTAYAIAAYADERVLARVDLATAELTVIGDSVYLWALAIHPVTGELYGVDEANSLFRLSKAAGPNELLGEVQINEDNTTFSLQIDGGGRFWIAATQPAEPIWEMHLWSFTLDTLATPVDSGAFTDDPYWTVALLLIPGDPPQPVLPVTGASEGVLPAVAGALVLLGAATVATAGIRRRAHA